MNNCLLFCSLLFVITLKVISTVSLNPCDDWVSYKDEKCFKVIETLGTEAEAEKNCSQLDSTSTLLTIHSKEEQDFVSNLLSKYSNKSDNVWIGLKLLEKTFKWMDDKDIDYKNWDDGCPDPTNPGLCVQMMLTKTKLGKWDDGSCVRKSLIVCQRRQEWTISELKKALENVTKLVNDQQITINALKSANESQHEINDNFQNLFISQKKSFDNITTQLNNSIIDKDNKIKALDQNLKTTAESLRQTLIPINFTYFQLPTEKSPQQVWPAMTWTDVSASYAGVFFRVVGGQAGQFGQVQADNSPRLSEVDTNYNKDINPLTLKNSTVGVGGWSSWICSGKHESPARFMRFHVSDGEVRPRNMAIRVWRRTK